VQAYLIGVLSRVVAGSDDDETGDLVTRRGIAGVCAVREVILAFWDQEEDSLCRPT